MRLVQVDGNGGLRLTKNLINHEYSYAILSHTWGDDEEEVSFEDLAEDSGKSKPAFRKLQFCARQATRDGLQHFWIDTCCIDQSNSVELSEAINSMYAWYRNSTKCYVYLADVSTNGCDHANLLDASVDSAFRKSRWFTRGWTLQELVAPSSVDFFSSEGEFLGCKNELEQTISEITGIPTQALQGDALSNFTINERLSWAESRHTKREEDMAYCLLGLFEVYMPPIYGEGKENALRRLQQEIFGRVNSSTERQLTIHSQPSAGFLNYGQDIPPYERFRLQEHLESTVSDWLGITHFDQKYNVHQHFDKQLSLHLSGTCEWIFDRPEYQQWESKHFPSGKSKFLWVHGPPGYGKTVICAHTIKHFKSMKHDQAAFFFCSSYAASAGSLSYVVRSWIYQIARSDSDALERVLSFRMGSEVRQTAPDTEIWSVFRSLLVQSQNLSFFLDGLDEYPRSNDDRADFLHRLKEASAGAEARFFITSRDETDIKTMLSHSSRSSDQLLLEHRISAKDVEHDVTLYSKSIVDQKLPNKQKHFREKLAQQISDKSEGMFLLVKMQQEHLKRYKNDKQLERTVTNMPVELNKIYERSWEDVKRNDPEDQERAIRILRWITFAQRPLTVSEISEAIAIELDNGLAGLQLDELPEVISDDYINDGIIRICGSLVEVRARDGDAALGNRTVHLVHPSAREFLQSVMAHSPNAISIRPPIDQREQSSQHELLARTCLTYLNDKRVWDFSDKEHPFLKYAATSWPLHVKHTGIENRQIFSEVDQFFNMSNENFTAWAEYYEKIQPRTYKSQNTGCPMYYAALFDLGLTMDTIWKRDPLQLNAVGGRYGTPLQATCATGNASAFEKLIVWGADPNVVAGEFGAALVAAACLNLKDMMVVLLEKGARLDSRCQRGRMALHYSATSGHFEAVQLLLDRGADLLARALEGGWQAVHMAAEFGHLEIVQLLLDRGTDATTTDNAGWQPVHTAAEFGRDKIVQLLLTLGVDIDATNSYGFTPLYLAARGGHRETVRILLNHGADPNISSTFGSTPLYQAARNGDLETSRLLLSHGVDVNTFFGKYGLTPLYMAASNGNNDLIDLLLQAGVPLTSVTRPLSLSIDRVQTKRFTRQFSAIAAAALHGHNSTVKFLLQKHAEMRQPVNDEDAIIAANPDADHRSTIYCDRCGTDIPYSETFYHCSICDDGDFDVCLTCFNAGSFCLDSVHVLKKLHFTADGSLNEQS